MKFDNSYSLSKISEFIHNISERNLNRISIETEFVKRKRNLEPVTFLKAFSFGVASLKEVSLEKIIDFCKDIQPNFSMSKQALGKHLKKGSLFLKEVLAYFLNKSLKMGKSTSKCVEILKCFDDIKIFDSTIIELSDELSSVWKGFDGDGSKSGIKISCMYSLYRKAFSAISIFNEVDNDRNFNYTAAKCINKNELAIADLGFFSNELFKTIISKKAYFISKVRKDSAFYDEIPGKKNKFRRIDILELLKKSNGLLDKYIYIGFKKDTRFKCRVIAQRLSDEIINQRLRKANKDAEKNRRAVKATDKEIMKWIIMITNIEAEKLSAEEIFEVYRIRWQIELVFKCWKSHVNLRNLKNIGTDYVECILYGKLILILFLYNLYGSLNYMYYLLNSKEISMIKFFELINEKYKEICLNLYLGIPYMNNIKCIIGRLISFSIREKRNRKTTGERLREISTPPCIDATAS